jgi:Cu/Ag efflux protein CusF
MSRLRSFALCIALAAGAAAHAQVAPPVYTSGEYRGTSQQGDRHYAHIKIAPGQKIPFSTLSYRLLAPDLVAKLKPGDRVSFRAERVDGENVLREIR